MPAHAAGDHQDNDTDVGGPAYHGCLVELASDQDVASDDKIIPQGHNEGITSIDSEMTNPAASHTPQHHPPQHTSTHTPDTRLRVSPSDLAILGDRYTSLVASLHSHHPELSPLVFSRAASFLGLRTLSTSTYPSPSTFTHTDPLTGHTQSTLGFDAPMDDKKDPAYLSLAASSNYMPHTDLPNTSPPLSFPQVTKYMKPKPAQPVRGYQKPQKKEKDAIEGRVTFGQKEYYCRQVLVPLAGGDAVVFPDATFEDLAFEGGGSAVDSEDTRVSSGLSQSPARYARGALVLKGRVTIAGSEEDSAYAADIHELGGASFQLTHEPWNRARRRLQAVLSKQCCPTHSSAFLIPTNPHADPSSSIATVRSYGPVFTCNPCQQALSTLRNFHRDIDRVVNPACTKPDHAAGKRDKECTACERNVKVEKAQKMREGLVRMSPEEELDSTRKRWEDEWPRVWLLSEEDWSDMRSKGVTVLRDSDE